MALTKTDIQSLNEARLRNDVIIPLLRAMGFQDVFEWHGPGEHGKDIVGWTRGALGERHNLCIVAKARRFSGASGCGEVAAQIRESFNESYSDPMSGRRQNVHECWVVVNKRIKKEARSQLRAMLKDAPLMERSTRIVDIEDLWELVSTHISLSMNDSARALIEGLERRSMPFAVEPQFIMEGRPFGKIEIQGTRYLLRESYPGQLDSDPPTISAVLSFPDTPEGKAALDAWNEAIRTGREATIPDKFISTFDMSDSLGHLVREVTGADELQFTSLTVGSRVPERTVRVSLVALFKDGERAELQGIELRSIRAGTEQITLSNEHQHHWVTVRLVVNTECKQMNLSFELRDTPLAAPALLKVNQIAAVAQQGGEILLVNSDTLLPIARCGHRAVHAKRLDDSWTKVLRILDNAQGKLQQPIFIPKSDFTEADWNAISKLNTLLSRSEIQGTWNDIKAVVQAKDVPAFVDAVRDGAGKSFRLEVEEELDLFDQQISLGRVTHQGRSLKVDNEQNVLALARDSDPDEQIEVTLVPGDDATMVSTYHDWT